MRRFCRVVLLFLTFVGNAVMHAGASSSRAKLPCPSIEWSKIKALHFFGDSYTSIGYSLPYSPEPRRPVPILGVPFPGKGSCNGPNWAAYLTSSKQNVTAYDIAEGGATVDQKVVTTFLPMIKSFRQQVRHWIERFHLPKEAIIGEETLLLAWFGINDINRSFQFRNISQEDLHDMLVGSYISGLEELYEYGARNFAVLNVPPIDLSPTFEGNPAKGKEARFAILDFNKRLKMGLDIFDITHINATAYYIDAHAIFSDAIANPHRFNLTVINGWCPTYHVYRGNANWETQLDPNCKVPVSEWLWLNPLHPTSGIHKYLAAYIGGENPQDVADQADRQFSKRLFSSHFLIDCSSSYFLLFFGLTKWVIVFGIILAVVNLKRLRTGLGSRDNDNLSSMSSDEVESLLPNGGKSQTYSNQE